MRSVAGELAQNHCKTGDFESCFFFLSQAQQITVLTVASPYIVLY